MSKTKEITISDSSSDDDDDNHHERSGKIEIDSNSLRCLDAGHMLNDTIIEFFMNHLLEDPNIPEVRRKCFHIFNPFFYKKLKDLHRRTSSSGDADKAFHETHRRWNKDVRLFEKDFLVMPICDHAHWLLVIICYANHLPPHDEPLIVNDIRALDREKQTNEPCIMIFDSLGFKQMSKFTLPIRLFLTSRWKFENPRAEARNFKDRTIFRDINVRVPRQTNTYDCGIHLLYSFETFISMPRHYYNQIRLGRDVKEYFRVRDTRLKRFEIKTVIAKSNKITRKADNSQKLKIFL